MIRHHDIKHFYVMNIFSCHDRYNAFLSSSDAAKIIAMMSYRWEVKVIKTNGENHLLKMTMTV